MPNIPGFLTSSRSCPLVRALHLQVPVRRNRRVLTMDRRVSTSSFVVPRRISLAVNLSSRVPSIVVLVPRRRVRVDLALARLLVVAHAGGP